MRMRAHRARVIKQGYAEHELATLSGRVAILALMAKEIAAIDRYERRAQSIRYQDAPRFGRTKPIQLTAAELSRAQKAGDQAKPICPSQ
jgi:hypothetical protein